MCQDSSVQLAFGISQRCNSNSIDVLHRSLKKYNLPANMSLKFYEALKAIIYGMCLTYCFNLAKDATNTLLSELTLVLYLFVGTGTWCLDLPVVANQEVY